MCRSLTTLDASELDTVTGAAGQAFQTSVDPFYQAKRLDPRYQTWRGGVQEGMQRPRYMFPSGRLTTLERMLLGFPLGLR